MRTKRLLMGFAVGLAAGLLLAPGLAGPGSQDEKDWERKFFLPLVWTVQQIRGRYVEEVDPQKLLVGAYEGMLNRLDEYSFYIPPEALAEFEVDTKGEFGGLGIQIKFLPLEKVLRIERPIPGTPAFKAGVLEGDIITKVREDSTGREVETKTFESVYDAVKILRGKPGTKVTITVVHRDTHEVADITIERAIIEIPGVRAVRMADEHRKIGYLYLAYFHERTVKDLDEALDHLKADGLRALILDLRFNPGGLLDSAVELSDRFLSEGVVVSTRGRASPELVFQSREGDVLDGAPLVVLVNHYSASASEIVAGALKDNGRAIVIGAATFGKGSVQTVMGLKDGEGALKFTTAKYYTPSGVSIEETGVQPDIEIKLTDEEVRELLRHLGETTEFPPKPEPESTEPEAGAVPPETGDEGGSEGKKKPFRDIQLERAVDVLAGILIHQDRMRKAEGARKVEKPETAEEEQEVEK